jgi:YHS domain-containing protein
VPIFHNIHEVNAKMVLDVVCKMDINEKTAKLKSEYKGKTYYFCASMCKQTFDKNPEKYAKSK